jgi:adenylate cyclase
MKRRARVSVGVVAAIASLTAAGLVLAARRAGWIERLELVAFDTQQRWLSRWTSSGTSSRVALVTVTEADIQRLGNYPLSDATLALAIERLEASGARAIGVDIYRDIPVPPGSDALAERFAANPRIVFPSKFADATSGGVAPPEGAQVGFNNMVVDRDGVARRGLLMMEGADGSVGVSFGLLLALFYLQDVDVALGPDAADPKLMAIGRTPLPRLDGFAGSYANVDTGGYQILLDCRRARAEVPATSLSQLIDDPAGNEIFRDRIAIVGVTAESLRDAFHVSCREGEIAGAALHALVANQLIRYGLGEAAAIRVLPEPAEALIVVVLVALGGAVGLGSRSTARYVVLVFAAIAGMWLVAMGALGLGWWIPVVPGGIGFVAASGAVTAFLTGRERADNAQLMRLFAQHVDAKIAEEVWRRRDEFLEGGRPRPKRVSVTVLFVDIRGYTTSAEKLDPEDLALWLDSYLSEFAKAIMDVGGFVVDYFGDGVMACFGVPVPRTEPEAIRRDAIAAVECALEMRSSLTRLNGQWSERNLPAIGLRIGIASGLVVAGDLGSADRLKYGVVGDVVNTAQRLESTTSVAHDFEVDPCRILVSARTAELVTGAFPIREVGQLLVKGKSEPVGAFQILGVPDSRVSDPAPTNVNEQGDKAS